MGEGTTSNARECSRERRLRRRRRRQLAKMSHANSVPAQAVHKIRWASAIMSEGYDFQSIRQIYKHHVIRKRMDRHLADFLIIHAGYAATDLWESFHEFERSPRLSNEAFGDTRIAVSIPSRCFSVLEFRRLDDLEWLQRPSTSRSTRSSTVRQSVLASSPARAAATLFSISRAQASSTSASASSKLSSSSAAIFARSSSGSSNASARSSRVPRAMANASMQDRYGRLWSMSV